MKKILAIACALFALAGSSVAQNAAGTLSGVVTDSSGSAIPNATVTVENTATNVKQTIPTNAEGRFYQRYVLPGTYSVTVEKTGFQKSITTDIVVNVEQTVGLTIALKVGDVATTVEVTASSAQLSTESSTVATTIGGRQFSTCRFRAVTRSRWPRLFPASSAVAALLPGSVVAATTTTT